MPPLKGIPHNMSADLLWALSAMGHGDEIVVADVNFPSFSTAKANGAKFIDMSGQRGLPVLESILALFPLDQYVDQPACVMARVECDEISKMPVPIWDDYQRLLNQSINQSINQPAVNVQIEHMERHAFYERAKKCFAVVATGEGAQYANIILKKGIIPFVNK